MFGYLTPQVCGEFCGCAAWERGEAYKVRSPIEENRRYPTVEFANKEKFWEWFWVHYPEKLTFDDFRLVGCWNWVREWDEFEYFSELYIRRQAAERLRTPSFTLFDDAPARLLDNLLIVDNEIQAAQVEYGRRKNKTV